MEALSSDPQNAIPKASEPSSQTYPVTETERRAAAGIIQRNYRGHRTRRQMKGLGLDPSTRWMEVGVPVEPCCSRNLQFLLLIDVVHIIGRAYI
jgi:hypothetical protein